jgi:undecaprenyl-diphosphatase
MASRIRPPATSADRILGLSWKRVVAWSAAGFLAAFLVGVGYASLIQSTGDWNSGLDWERRLLLSIDRTMPPAFDAAMLVLPWLGTNLTIMPVLLGVEVWLVRARHRWDLAVHLLVVQVGSLVLNAALKGLYDRARPDLWPKRGQFQWAAFPSGHAIVGVSVMFTIAYLLHRERGWRWPYVAAATLLMVSAYSRLYLGVHWPTDVIGGGLVGIVWLMMTRLAFRRYEHLRDLTADSAGVPGGARAERLAEG